MSFGFRLSIGANVVLMGIVAVLLWCSRSAVPSVVASPPRTVGAQFETPRTDMIIRERPRKSDEPKLNSSAVAQLEHWGISRDTLVNVLLEALNRRSAKRVLELQKKYAPRLVPDREMRELSRQNDAEQSRELKAVFGETGYLAWDKEQTLRNLNRARMPGDELSMTTEEAERAYRLQKEFDDKNQELQMAMEDGVADKADAGTLQAEAQQALDRELEKLLGKKRFDELRGNIDPATEVYRTYSDLNPTPEQANAVVLAEEDYRAREAALVRRLNENPADATKVTTELKAMSDAQDQTLRQIFGAAAYENVKRQNDPTYKILQHYAGAWDLKDGEVQSVYETIHAFQDQAERTRNAAEISEGAGQRVNWREINSGIEQARQQTATALQNLIGGERLQRLKQNEVLTTR